jgi:hypothetical protein
MSDKDELDDLFLNPENQYGSKYKEDLFDQYKLYLEMIDNLNDRRSQANNFFLSINTGLLTAFGIISSLGASHIVLNNIWIVVVGIAGILFSYAWYRIVKSYSQLSSGKWKIIQAIEKKMPLNLHDVEWKILGEGKQPSTYKPLTDVERIVPIIFSIVYSALIGFSIYLFTNPS